MGTLASTATAAGTVSVTLLAASDFHTQLEPPTSRCPDHGGAAYLAALVLVPHREAVDPAVEEVVAAGADIVVVLWHDGSRQVPAGTLDPNGCESMDGPSWDFRHQFHDAVDLVEDGHGQSPYVCNPADAAMLTQARDRGSMHTEITLTFDTAAGDVVDRVAVNRAVTHDLAPGPAVVDLVDHSTAMGNGSAPPEVDLDLDTLGDGYEVLVAGSDPYDTDTDDDQLDDDREVYIHDSGPTNRDTDGGGALDGEAVAAGLDPTHPYDDALLPVVTSVSGGLP